MYGVNMCRAHYLLEWKWPYESQHNKVTQEKDTSALFLAKKLAKIN